MKATSATTIVTAFYDIGRGEWSSIVDAHWLDRNTSIYVQRFLYLAQLKNNIVLFLSDNEYDVIKHIVKQKKLNHIRCIKFEPKSVFKNRLQEIDSIQKSVSFRSQVAKSVKSSPEYWNPLYVLVTNLKVFFMKEAYLQGLIRTEDVAWIDFGYVRTPSLLPDSLLWAPKSLAGKFRMQKLKEYDGKGVSECIFENDVYIGGMIIQSPTNKVLQLDRMMEDARVRLLKMGIVDDDQGLLLSMYLDAVDEFTFTTVNDWQQHPNRSSFTSLIYDNTPIKPLKLYRRLAVYLRVKALMRFYEKVKK